MGKEYIDLAKSAFDQVSVLLAEEPVEPNWEYVTEVEACAMYRRIAPEENNASGIYTVRTMVNFIWNLDNRKKFDAYINTLDVIVDIKDELDEPVKACDVLYAAFSMPFPITGRDFVHIRAWKEHEGGYLTSAKSTTHPDRPDTSNVRGSIDVDGFLIKPNPKDPSKATVNYIARVDPKGSIPSFAVNLANRKVPQTLASIRKAIKESEAK